MLGLKKTHGFAGWVLHSQTHAHKPAGFVFFLPINKPAGIKIDPYPYANRVKTQWVAGTH